MLARPKATHAVHAHGLTRAPAALAHWIAHQPMRATIRGVILLVAPTAGLPTVERQQIKPIDVTATGVSARQARR
jgi:hypothetical protein